MLDLKRNYNGKWTGSAADQLGTYLTVLIGNKCWGKAGFVLPIQKSRALPNEDLNATTLY